MRYEKSETSHNFALQLLIAIVVMSALLAIDYKKKEITSTVNKQQFSSLSIAKK